MNPDHEQRFLLVILCVCIGFILFLWISLSNSEEVGIRTGAAFPGWGTTQHVLLREIYYETSPLANWTIYPTIETTVGSSYDYDEGTYGIVGSLSSKWHYDFSSITWFIGAGISGHSLYTFPPAHLGGSFLFRLQTGITIPITHHINVSVAYHHFSNAFLYYYNHGMDMGVFGVSYTW
jgi:hypothetical protein